jgi:hypothetical protein
MNAGHDFTPACSFVAMDYGFALTTSVAISRQVNSSTLIAKPPVVVVAMQIFRSTLLNIAHFALSSENAAASSCERRSTVAFEPPSKTAFSHNIELRHGIGNTA